MVLTLHSNVNKLRGWSEGCYCHEQLRQGLIAGQSSFQARLAVAFQKSWVTTCPLAGMRAHELACGGAHKVLQEAAKGGMAELMSNISQLSGMSNEFLAQVMSDYELAVGHLKGVLGIKTRYWQQLPWLLHGLCHPDHDRAKECAQQCLRAFNDSSPEHGHCPVTLSWLGPASALREYVVSLAEGGQRDEFPGPILCEIALLRFVNVSERRIEGAHKTVKLDLALTAASPMAVSAAIRLDPFLTAAERGAVDIPEYLCCLHEARQAHKLAASLGVESHPDLIRAYGKETAARHSRFQMLKRLVYRSDYENPFADLSAIASANDVMRKKERLACMRRFHVPMRKALAAQIWPMLMQHMRLKLSEGSIFSLPSAVQVAALDKAWDVNLRQQSSQRIENQPHSDTTDEVPVTYDDLFFRMIKVPPIALGRFREEFGKLSLFLGYRTNSVSLAKLTQGMWAGEFWVQAKESQHTEHVHQLVWVCSFEPPPCLLSLQGFSSSTENGAQSTREWHSEQQLGGCTAENEARGWTDIRQTHTTNILSAWSV